jgi:hypothetical protein
LSRSFQQSTILFPLKLPAFALKGFAIEHTLGVGRKIVVLSPTGSFSHRTGRFRPMQNDAKFGLVVGVGLVVTVAVMFFQKSPADPKMTPASEVAGDAKKNRPATPAMLPPGQCRPARVTVSSIAAQSG